MKTSLLIPLVVFMLLNLQNIQSQFYQPPQTVAEPVQIRTWLEKEMVYPEDERNNKIQGTVEIAFTINAQGNSSHFKVVSGVSPAIDKEAIRLLRKLLWMPASNAGQAIDAEHTYSIKFNVRQYNRIIKKRGYVYRTLPFEAMDTTQIIYNFAALDEAPKPIFENSKMSLNRYIQQQLQYPNAALTLSISGTVSLGFVIEEHGLVSNIHVIHSVGGGCDNEAIRILQSIDWQPGIKNNVAVRSHGKLDITFQLPDASRQQAVPNQQQRSM